MKRVRREFAGISFVYAPYETLCIYRILRTANHRNNTLINRCVSTVVRVFLHEGEINIHMCSVEISSSFFFHRRRNEFAVCVRHVKSLIRWKRLVFVITTLTLFILSTFIN